MEVSIKVYLSVRRRRRTKSTRARSIQKKLIPRIVRLRIDSIERRIRTKSTRARSIQKKLIPRIVRLSILAHRI